MAKTMYIGVNGVARKVKSIYVGVDGVARKVKSGYVGVGGVARQFWVSEFTVTIIQSANQTIKVTCNGTTYTSSFTAPAGGTYTVTVTPATGYNAGTPNVSSGTLNSNVTISATAATIKKFTYKSTGVANALIPASALAKADEKQMVLYGGGTYFWSFAVIDILFACNTSGTWIKTTAGKAVGKACGASVGKYAVFGGGNSGPSGTHILSDVNAYDSSLVRVIAPAMSSARELLAAASTADHALFTSGRSTQGSGTKLSTVDAYDKSLTRTSAPNISDDHSTSVVGASFNDKAVFKQWNKSEMNVYNQSLTRTIVNSVIMENFQVPAINDKYLFYAGKRNDSSYVICYDDSFTKKVVTPLSISTDNVGSTDNENYAIFISYEERKDVVDFYNNSLTRSNDINLPHPFGIRAGEGDGGAAAALLTGNYAFSIGNLLVFAEGIAYDLINNKELPRDTLYYSI